MKKFATKAVATMGAAAMLLGAMAPAMAVTERFPLAAPGNGVRMSLTDTVSVKFTDHVIDLTQVDEMETLYEMGDFYVYGDNQDDDNGVDSFENVVLDFSDANLSAFGMVVMNSSNTNNVVYDVYVDNLGGVEEIGNLAAGAASYWYTNTEDVPGTGLSSLRDMLEDGVTQANLLAQTAGSAVVAGQFVDPLTLTDKIGDSDVQVGDPDVMTDYVDEVWVYTIADNGDEYAWHLNLELGMAMQDDAVDAPSSIKVVTRGTRGRVDVGMPADPSGVVGYQLDLDGAGLFETTYSVMFFDTVLDDDYDVEVVALNAEGDESETVTASTTADYTYSASLSDIADTTFESQVGYLYKLGIIDGYSNGSYGPDDTVTRGQLAKFVMNTFGLPYNLSGEWFSDVAMTDTFAPYIQSLKNAGVIGGFSDGTFRADDSVTRGAAAKFTVNAARYFDVDSIDNGTCSFGDSSDGTFQTFASYICALVDFGTDEEPRIVSGYSNGDFGAADVLTRGQMAKFMLHAGAMIARVETVDADVDGFDDTFINVTNFLRVFVPSLEVDDFDEMESAVDAISFEFRDMSASGDDASIDGYVVEYKEEGQDWERLDQIGLGGIQAIAQSDTVQVTGVGAAGDTHTITVDMVNYTYTTVAADTVLIVADELAAQVNANPAVTAVSDGVDTVTVTAKVAGDPYTISVAVTGGSTFNVLSPVVVQANVVGTDIDEGVILTGALAAPVGNMNYFSFTDGDEDTNYDFRMATFKFVPFQYSEADEYNTQALMEAVTEYKDIDGNAVMSTWVELASDTRAEDSN